ncbi:hypothetical protein ACN4EE_00800 [Geminocystis sp. CENA526]|uniref:hypothetical protein n=1 Tax=Geminocystis sp. CENA526 TaxID=1355871 RepID=UPI003D6E13BC
MNTENPSNNNQDSDKKTNLLFNSFKDGILEVLAFLFKNLGKVFAILFLITATFFTFKYFGNSMIGILDADITPILGGTLAGLGSVWLISIIPALSINPIIGIPIGIIVWLIMYTTFHTSS